MIGRRRWGFRARLAALIAGVFITGGVVLLGVQYLLVKQLFAQGISAVTTGCVAGELELTQVGGAHSGTVNDALATFCELQAAEHGEVAFGGGAAAVVIEQTTHLSEEVLSGLLIWSLLVLAVFAALAVLAAWWLSKRSLGRIAQITSAAKDITRDDLHRRLELSGPDDEVKELGDTIDGMLDRLDDAFTRQERFIAGASHELRTPLTTTRTALEIPLAQGRVPSGLEPDVRLALAANERSERLIAALLTLARSEHDGAAGSSADVVDLSELVAEICREHEAEAEERRAHMSLALQRPMHVAADRALLEIAVSNLLENAIRHGPEGGSLTVRTARAAETAWIEIDNDGAEITAAEATRLVEPFNRGAGSRLAGGGTGLGLTLVETIARSQQGTLTLSPRRSGGLTARLTLPLG